jgi:alpha-D-ribose 1-methylphosphonate 5-triphosphate synthase subunit PhnL
MMLDVRGLGKSFTLHGLGGKTIVGCRDVSFKLKAGSALAITGVSGSGKSTVLKCLNRTYIPTTGQLYYRVYQGNTVDLAALNERQVLGLRRREIAYIPQFLRVVPRVTCLDVVADHFLEKGGGLKDARQAAAAMLNRLRLPSELWDAYPANFSGGEKQRVNIARACLTKPRLLLVDEPTASLDSDTKREVIDLLIDLKSEGVTMVLVLHDWDVVERLADSVVRMEEGVVCPVNS